MNSLKISELKQSKMLIIAACAIAVLIVTIHREEVTQSCVFAINICLNLIIPTLFPIQMLMYMILNTGLPLSLKNRIHNLTIRLFGLSGNCAEGILLGMTGGYNAAIKTAVALYSNNAITKEEAKRLSVYFSNPGISFCILIFGNSIYKSFGIGLFVFTVSNLVSLIIAFFKRPKNSDTAQINEPNNKHTSFWDSFILSVNNAGKTVISICLWILVFAVIKAAVKSIIPFTYFSKLFDIFSDISTGLFIAAENYSLPFCVFTLLSGGICIHLQQTEDIRYLGIDSAKMLAVRLFNAAITSFITSAALKFNIFNSIVSAVSYSTKLISGTPVSSLSLILLTAVFFSLLSERKKYNYQIN